MPAPKYVVPGMDFLDHLKDFLDNSPDVTIGSFFYWSHAPEGYPHWMDTQAFSVRSSDITILMQMAREVHEWKISEKS